MGVENWYRSSMAFGRKYDHDEDTTSMARIECGKVQTRLTW